MPDRLNKRVLVIGGTGFIGAPLCTKLAERGASVVVLARQLSPTCLRGFEIYAGDASIFETVNNAIRTSQPDIIYHLVSFSKGSRELELVLPGLHNDVLSAINMLVAAKQGGVERVIMASSLEEPFGNNDADLIAPISPYTAAKYVSSLYARMFKQLYQLNVCLLRPMMVYGPGQAMEKFVPAVTSTLLAGRPITINSGNRPVDWIYVDDVVDAFVRAADAAPPCPNRAIDLGSGKLVRVREVAIQIASAIGVMEKLSFAATSERGVEVVRVAETGAAEQFLGWRATTSLASGLAQTIQRLRERKVTD